MSTRIGEGSVVDSSASSAPSSRLDDATLTDPFLDLVSVEAACRGDNAVSGCERSTWGGVHPAWGGPDVAVSRRSELAILRSTTARSPEQGIRNWMNLPGPRGEICCAFIRVSPVGPRPHRGRSPADRRAGGG